ncbi:MAG: MazG family protein [Planctomycetota bacterium]|jgi:MazG family protein
MKESTKKAMEGFEGLFEILQKLRSPEGCPWDRKQTEKTMAPLILEEAYEVADAIEEGKAEKIAEELGDLSMNLFMTSLIAEEKCLFETIDVFKKITTKLINRHPHVFGDAGPMDEDKFLHLWEDIKRNERQTNGEDSSAVAGIPKALPALQRAFRLLEKMKRSGLPLPVFDDPIERIQVSIRHAKVKEESIADLEGRVGELLVALVLFCIERKVNPEMILRAELTALEEKFRKVESTLKGRPASDVSREEVEKLWNNNPSEPETT